MNPKKGKDLSVSIEKSQFNSLVETIRKLVKVIAATQIEPDAGTERNARFLKVFGLSDYEIADLLGTDRSTVSKALSKSKKKTRKDQKG